MIGAFTGTPGGGHRPTLNAQVDLREPRWGRTALHLAVEQNHVPAALYLSEMKTPRDSVEFWWSRFGGLAAMFEAPAMMGDSDSNMEFLLRIFFR